MTKPLGKLRFHPRTPTAMALALTLAACGPSPPKPATPAPLAPPHAVAGLRREIAPAMGAPIAGEDCDTGPAGAARRNADGMRRLVFAPFHRTETGWEIYAPLAAHEIGTRCAGDSPAFARHLSAWQAAHGLDSSGVMDEATFAALKAIWQARRPFVAANRLGCPAPPPETSLAVVPAEDSFGGKSLLLRPGALAAYRRMLAAARAAQA